MNDIEKYIREVMDFPKNGVQFKDITPLLANPQASKLCLKKLLEMVGSEKIDKVVGIESRGFFYGTLLAHHLNAGFVPIRKPGKLPYKTITEPYELEYGLDSLEMHEDAIVKGDRVLLHDDVNSGDGVASCPYRRTRKRQNQPHDERKRDGAGADESRASPAQLAPQHRDGGHSASVF